MAKLFLTGIDLNKNELLNPVLHNLGSAPASPKAGQVYYSTTDSEPYYWNGTAWIPLGGDGVESVGLSAPSIFSVSGSPVTSTGTLSFALVNQTGNTVFASPSGGTAGQPTFRSLVANDLPVIAIVGGTSGTLTVTRGGTGATSLTGVVIGNGVSAMSAIAGAGGQMLRRNTANTAYEFFTPTFLDESGVRASISLTTTGTSGVATYNQATGVFNIPNYTYTHPTQTAIDQNATGAAEVISRVVVNTLGHVTLVSKKSLTAADIGAIPVTEKASANGVATLDAGGKVPLSQMSDAVLGQVEYMGTWNASTNVPTLPLTPAKKGDYYVVTVGGTQFGNNYDVGDWIISDGVKWDKVDNTDAVSTVFGRMGNVVAQAADYNAFYVRHDTASQGLTATNQGNARTNINAQVTITGGASSITTVNLTASRLLVSDASGKVAVSTVTLAEAGFLAGVTSSIQTQINSKFNTPSGTTAQYIMGNGALGTFPVAMPLAELNTGTATTARLMTADVLKSWFSTSFDARTFTQTIGNGTLTSFSLTHNLNTRGLVVSIYDTITWEEVEADVKLTTLNSATIEFTDAPASNRFLVVVK